MTRTKTQGWPLFSKSEKAGSLGSEKVRSEIVGSPNDDTRPSGYGHFHYSEGDDLDSGKLGIKQYVVESNIKGVKRLYSIKQGES